MRGLRRHRDENRLDEKGRSLIHRYMAEVDEPDARAFGDSLPERSEESELAAAAITISPASPVAVEQLEAVEEPEVVEPPIVAAAVEAGPPADPAPADVVIRLHPPKADRQVTFDVSHRTLEQVARLCVQVDWARRECNRRREGLAAAAPRRIVTLRYPTG